MVIFKTCLNFSAYKGSGVGVEGGDGVSGMRQGCVRDALLKNEGIKAYGRNILNASGMS
jgi:hypothetical protein